MKFCHIATRGKHNKFKGCPDLQGESYFLAYRSEPKIIKNSYCTPSPLSSSLFSLPLSLPFLSLSLSFIAVFPLLSLSLPSPPSL